MLLLKDRFGLFAAPDPGLAGLGDCGSLFTFLNFTSQVARNGRSLSSIPRHRIILPEISDFC